MISSTTRSGATDAPIRVIIADDDPLARRALRDALQEAGVIVIAEAASGGDAVQLALHYEPDVVLMDVTMSGLDGVAATRTLRARAPHVNVVMLSATSDDDELALMCLHSGASGFLSKAMSLASLPRALRAVVDGEAAISRRLTAYILEGMRRAPLDGIGLRPVRSPLTPREWEVLDLLCRHAGTDEMAEALVLSTETVRTHVKNILRKLGVGSREQAVEAARKMRAELVPAGMVA